MAVPIKRRCDNPSVCLRRLTRAFVRPNRNPSPPHCANRVVRTTHKVDTPLDNALNAASNASGNIRSHRTSLCLIRYPFSNSISQDPVERPVTSVFHPVFDILMNNYPLLDHTKRTLVHLAQPAAVQSGDDHPVRDLTLQRIVPRSYLQPYRPIGLADQPHHRSNWYFSTDT